MADDRTTRRGPVREAAGGGRRMSRGSGIGGAWFDATTGGARVCGPSIPGRSTANHDTERIPDMLRLTLLLTAVVALAAASVGCTHCDTCGAFPIPSVGGHFGPMAAPTG